MEVPHAPEESAIGKEFGTYVNPFATIVVELLLVGGGVLEEAAKAKAGWVPVPQCASVIPHHPYWEQQGKVLVQVNFLEPPQVPCGSTFTETLAEEELGVDGEGLPPKAKPGCVPVPQ